jgi:hypothetical protein
MFENPLSTSTKNTHDNVLITTSKGVPLDELGHSLHFRTQHKRGCH